MSQFDQMRQEMESMKQEMANANQLKGFFESMISDGKLVQDADGNIDVPPQHLTNNGGMTAGR